MRPRHARRSAGHIERSVLFSHLPCRFETIADPRDTGFTVADTVDVQSGGRDPASNRERPGTGARTGSGSLWPPGLCLVREPL